MGKKINLKEVLIVQLLIFSALAASFIPTIYYVAIAPPTTIFPLIHNNHPDYYYYLSLMRQGLEGRWLVTSRFTPETFPPRLAQSFFVLLGQISKITSIDLPMIYTLSRLIFGLALGLSIYFLIALFDKKTTVRIAGMIFALFGSGFWFIKNGEINRFMSFWTGFDARERVSFLPHHLLAAAAIVVSIIFLSLLVNTKEKNYLVLACLTGFVGACANPISLSNLFLALILTMILLVIGIRQHRDDLKKIVFPVFIYLVAGGIPFIYFFTIRQTTFPWTNYKESLRMVIDYPFSFKEYLLSLGPVGLLAILGIKDVWRRKNFLSIIIISWFLTPFIGIFVIAKLFNTGNAYFFNAAHYIPTAIIGAIGFINPINLISKKTGFKKNLLLIPLTMLLIGYFSVSWYGSIKKEIGRWTTNSYNIFLPSDFIMAFKFLDEHSVPESVVLTGRDLGNIIPAFTHNRTVIGHIVNTFDPATKYAEAERFFSQTDAAFARRLIKKYRIAYVFYALDTPPPQAGFINALRLKKIYQNPTVAIFSPQKIEL